MQAPPLYGQREPSNPSTSASSALTSNTASPKPTPTVAPMNPYENTLGPSAEPTVLPPRAVHSLPPSNTYASNFPQFSPATEEILKRVSANASAASGTPGWEAAREQVLRGMVTSESLGLPSSASVALSRRGRGGPALTSSPRQAHDGGSEVVNDTAILQTTPAPIDSKMTPVSGRGRGRGGGRGRGRGGGRGGKRKAADSDESEIESDISSSYTPLPTRTKSGRNVQKPVAFSPALPSEPGSTKRRRVSRKGPEAAVCSVCLRGHSPTSNMIVFCDICNTPYHQFCHDPPIDREVVAVAEKEWFCGTCRSARESLTMGFDGRISGEGLTLEEKRAYLSGLSSATLVSLLVHATIVYPSLPIFEPKTRELLQSSTSTATLFQASVPPQSTHVQSHSNGYPSISYPTSQQLPTPAPSNPYPTHPPSNHFPYESQHQALPLAGPYDSLSHSMAQPHPSHQQHDAPQQSAPAPAKPPSPAANQPSPDAEGEPDQDQFDGYDTDPPAHYVKAGNGVAGKLMRPEVEDLPWLVDDNFSVFSHTVRDPSDGRYVPVSGIGGVQGAEGATRTGRAQWGGGQ